MTTTRNGLIASELDQITKHGLLNFFDGNL